MTGGHISKLRAEQTTVDGQAPAQQLLLTALATPPRAGFVSADRAVMAVAKTLAALAESFSAAAEFSRQLGRKAYWTMAILVDDALICERLIAGLARVGLHNLQCRCDRGVVMLSGDLTDPDDRTLAHAVGHTTAGVIRLVIK